MLEAMEAEWSQRPPVHMLVAAYLDYKPPRAVQTSTHDDAGTTPDWAAAGVGALPGPQAARDAATPEAALAAFEQHFFGEVKDVSQL